MAKVGLGIIAAFLILGAVGPFVYHISPYAVGNVKNSAPDWGHPMGTDNLGHDVFSQLIWGMYPSMFVGIAVALGATILGLVVGVLAGYYDRLEGILTGIADVTITFPAVAVMLLIGSIFKVSDALIIAILVVILWPLVARPVRSQVLSLKTMAFVDAAKMSGMSNRRIIFRVITPGVGSLAFAYFVLNIAGSIILVTILEFLGIGNPSIVSWGSMLFWAEQFAFFYGDWWWIVAPGLSIGIISLGFALIGFSVEQVMNPRLIE